MADESSTNLVMVLIQDRILAKTDLAEAKEKIQQQAVALTETLTHAQALGNANADGNQAPQVQRLKPSTKEGQILIQEAMGLDGKDELYGSIQVSVFSGLCLKSNHLHLT